MREVMRELHEVRADPLFSHTSTAQWGIPPEGLPACLLHGLAQHLLVMQLI